MYQRGRTASQLRGRFATGLKPAAGAPAAATRGRRGPAPNTPNTRTPPGRCGRSSWCQRAAAAWPALAAGFAACTMMSTRATEAREHTNVADTQPFPGPYPTGWRPTWARLAIFLDPEQQMYKLYAVSESSLEHGGERRIAAEDQPSQGFKTLRDARRGLAEADPTAEVARLRRHRGGEPTPPGETEVESIRATGDPRRRASKADPGGLPADLDAAFRTLSAAVTARQRPGAALRITISPDGTEEFLVEAGQGPEGGVETLAKGTCREFMDQALDNLGMTTDEVLQRIVQVALQAKTGRSTPARTLWNEPPLVVCGAPKTVVNELRELRTTRPREVPRKDGAS